MKHARQRFLPTLRASHAVFVAVLLVRLAALARLPGSVLFLPRGGDMRFYHEWAQRVARGELADGAAFYGLPLYPWFVGGLYRLFGVNPFVPILFQAAADAGTATLIYLLAGRTLSDANLRAKVAAIAAACGWMLFVPAQAFAVVLMPTTLIVLAFWLLIWLLLRTPEAPGRFGSLGFGVIVGLCATAVANILFIAPLVAARVLLQRRRGWPLAVALLAAGVLLGTAPCWGYNYFVAREHVFLSSHSGINFWLGNNAAATGYPHFPGGMRAEQATMLEDSTRFAEQAVGRSLTRSEVSAYWAAQARAFIVTHPVRWLQLVAAKFANFWNAFQYDDVGIVEAMRGQRLILPGLRFGVIAVFGIAGALVAVPTQPLARWIAAAVLLHAAAVLTVFVTERYRITVVPGLLVLGGLGLATFYDAVATARWKQSAVYLGIVCATTAAVATPRRNPSLWALQSYNAGRYALEAGDLRSAETHLQRAHAYVSENAETNLALGNLRVAQHNAADARRFYLAAVAADPRAKSALMNLGVLALDSGNWDEARQFFARTTTVAPRDAKAHFLLAKANLELGDTKSAELAINRAISLEPNQPEFLALREQIGNADTRRLPQ